MSTFFVKNDGFDAQEHFLAILKITNYHCTTTFLGISITIKNIKNAANSAF